MSFNKKRKNTSPFASMATDGIKNGDVISAESFRKMRNEAELKNAQSHKSSQRTPKDRKKKKKEKKSREQIIFEIKHNVNRWDALYRGEVARLESNPDLIKRDKEYYYQVKVMLYIAEHYPNLQYVTHASPNGGSRSGFFEAFRLSCAGLSKGHPDVQVLYPINNYHGLFIEMKKEFEDYRNDKVALSEVSYYQHLHRLKLLETGFMAVVCYGYEEAIDTVKRYMEGKKPSDLVLHRWDNYDWESLAKLPD